MRIAITGSSGLVGTALVDLLRQEGHDVVRVVRSAPAPGEVRWDPEAGEIDADGLEGLDGVVHLAARSVGERRWTAAEKRRVRDSRTKGTDLLARTLASLRSPPRVLLSASGVNVYGDTGDTAVTEASPPGRGFLASVVHEWERAVAPARGADIRVVLCRSGVILSRHGGALTRMARVFKLGIGGRLGSGRQWMSWITLDDEIRALRFLLDHDGLEGGVNLVSPQPVTNAEFTRALGRALHRPTILPVPRFAPGILYGRELVDELLFTSLRIRPAALEAAGFEFHHPEIEPALRAVLGKETP